MAENTVNINLSLLDQQGTIKKRTTEVENLNNKLEKTQSLASNAFSATGTKTGAQALRATEAPDSTVRLQRTVVSTGLQDNMREQSRPQPRRATYGDNEDYTMAGGVTGRGGAGARDFADEARGLGGLVRLYATYAANIFAVTAAFSALREAMNTDVMIRGMQQLGAQSGTSLVSMSKGFIAATDGMISLREASEAVTKATTSGMGREQVMAIAEVAKGASQALGLNMSDAVSRLTRGITKLEPELLDELGLFTKLDKAVTDYARSVGKTEGQLSDFERRQAFANAVLAEGRQKFSEIAQEGNPYDQLLASLKNVAQDILSVVNTVIAPIAKILAENTGLITAGIALMALKITQMAIPAMGKYADYLKKSADSAAAFSAIQSERASKSVGDRAMKELGIPQLDDKIVALKKERVILKEQQELLNKQNLTVKERIGLQNELAVKMAKLGLVEAETERKRLENILDKQMQRPLNIFSDFHEMMTKSIEKSTARDATSKGIRSQVVENYLDEGMISSFKMLTDLIGKASDKLGFFGKIGAFVSGTLGIFGQGLLTVTKFIAGKLPLIGTLITAYEVLDMLFDKNAKQVQKFESALEELEDTTKTAKDVTEKFKGILTEESINAIANSFNGVAGSIAQVNQAFREADAAKGWFNTITDSLKEIIPGLDSLQEKASEGLGKSLAQLIKSAPTPDIEKQITSTIRGVLGAETKLTEAGIGDRLESLSKVDFTAASKQLEGLVQEIAKYLQSSNILVKNVDETSKAAEKSFLNLVNSVKSNNPQSLFLIDIIKRTDAIKQGFKDSIAAYGVITDLLQQGTTGIVSLGLDDKSAFRLQENLKAYEQLLSQEKALASAQSKNEEELAKLQAKNINRVDGDAAFGRGARRRREDLGKELADVEARTRAGREQLQTLRGEMQKLQADIQELFGTSVERQLDRFFEGYNLRLQKSQVETRKALAALGPKVETIAGVREEANLNKQAINIESRLADINERLVLAAEIQRISLEENTDAVTRATLEQQLARAREDKSVAEQVRIGEKLAQLDRKQSKGISSAEIQKAIASGDMGTIRAAISGGATQLANILPIMEGISLRKNEVGNKLRVENVKQQLAEIGVTFNDQIQQINTDVAKSQALFGSLQLPAGYKELVDISQQESKNRAAVLEYDKQIAQLNKELLLTPERKDVINQELEKLNIKKQDLEIEQKLALEGKKRTAEITIQVERIRALGQLSQASGEATLRLIDTSTSVGMAAAEELRRSLFAQSQAVESQVFGLETKPFQDTIAKLKQERNIAGSEGGMGLAAFDVSQTGKDLKIAEATLAEKQFLFGIRQSTAGVKELADAELARRNIQMKIYDERVAAEVRAQGLEKQRFDISQEFAQAEVQRNDQRLQVDQSLGLLTGQQLQDKRLQLELLKVEIGLTGQLRTITDGLIEAERVRDRVLAQAMEAGPAAPGSAAAAAIAQANAELEAKKKSAEQSRASVIAGAQANKDFLTEQANLSDRQKAYAQQFNQAFQGMAQSIIDFAKTGKLEFKSLITSLIEGLIKYELQLQMTALYSATVRPLLFGGAQAIGSAVMSAFTGTPTPTAMGAAYSSGIKRYAMGGTFTNQIVNQPTLFKAANGLGIMGEAGPEAIMPLQRDSRGRLGVSGGGNDVSVVVNNYGKERAEVKESTDGRGNRRIEVVVGEMVAGEMTRVGSPLQQTFTNNYGLAMPVGRR